MVACGKIRPLLTTGRAIILDSTEAVSMGTAFRSETPPFSPLLQAINNPKNTTETQIMVPVLPIKSLLGF